VIGFEAIGSTDVWLARLWSRRTVIGVAVLVGALIGMVAGVHWLWAAVMVVALTCWAALVPLSNEALEASRTTAVTHATRMRSEGSPSSFGDPGGRIWQALIGSSSDPAIVLDGQKMVLVANAAARSLFDIQPGRHLAEAVRAPELLSAVDLALAGREQHVFQIRLVVPTERNLSGHVTPLGDVADGVPSLAIVLRDQTEQDRLARMRADFVANASHELRTPLASLKGFVETLRGAAKDDPVARDRFLAIMQADADRMARLIDDLLSLSRIEMREHVTPRDAVDLLDLVRGVVAGLEARAHAAKIAMTLRATGGATTVTGDRDDLEQLVQNLVQNAIKYGRPGGKVDIALHQQGAQICLTVTDDGIGIAPENVPRLTERFYRVNAKQSRERGGTGLGLAIVKHIVNRHRGSLDVTSKLGEGSEFKVKLPASVGSGAEII
jgi:two-component system, OmpR family, phosphate regulon sensor histidine kinase PhoR